MNEMRIRALAAAASLAVVAVLSGCGGGGSDEPGSTLAQPLRAAGGGIEGTGIAMANLQLAATATPACGYQSVHITIERIRVHQTGGADPGAGGWAEVVLSPALRVDLATLGNAPPLPLGGTPLEGGHYTQMRLVLAPNTASNPLANSVTPNGGTETALATPSAQSSGLKLNVDMSLPAGSTSRFALGFDTCQSVVQQGGSGSYSLTPVITLAPMP